MTEDKKDNNYDSGKSKIEPWPDGPGYFSKTNVEAIVRNLDRDIPVLMSFIVNHPAMCSLEDISED